MQTQSSHKQNRKEKLYFARTFGKINNFVSNDHFNKSHSESQGMDAAQRIADMKLLRTLDCTQACLCLQMADAQLKN